jgi:hypothetical protein
VRPGGRVAVSMPTGAGPQWAFLGESWCSSRRAPFGRSRRVSRRHPLIWLRCCVTPDLMTFAQSMRSRSSCSRVPTPGGVGCGRKVRARISKRSRTTPSTNCTQPPKSDFDRSQGGRLDPAASRRPLRNREPTPITEPSGLTRVDRDVDDRTHRRRSCPSRTCTGPPPASRTPRCRRSGAPWRRRYGARKVGRY